MNITRDGFQYNVLFTRIVHQWDFVRTVRKEFPKERGSVFIPCYELWWRGSEQTKIKPLFLGYVFFYSDLGLEEIHIITRKVMKETGLIAGELNVGRGDLVSQNKKPSFDVIEENMFFDINEDEASFLDFMRQFKTDGQDGNRDKDITGEAILKMSRGYREKGRIVIMEGPLKGYEEHIVDVNTRQRKAYLDISIKGHVAKAGLYFMGKRYYYPDDKDAPSLLSDGSEVDTKELSKIMMEKKR